MAEINAKILQVRVFKSNNKLFNLSDLQQFIDTALIGIGYKIILTEEQNIQYPAIAFGEEGLRQAELANIKPAYISSLIAVTNNQDERKKFFQAIRDQIVGKPVKCTWNELLELLAVLRKSDKCINIQLDSGLTTTIGSGGEFSNEDFIKLMATSALFGGEASILNITKKS